LISAVILDFSVTQTIVSASYKQISSNVPR